MIFIPNVFLQPLNSFEIIFRRENLVCTEANFKTCLFVYFLSPVVFADCRRTNIDWLGYSKPQNLSSVCQNANKGAEAKKAAHPGRRYFSFSSPSHSRLRRSLSRLRRFCLCARNPTIPPATQATPPRAERDTP